MPSVITDIVGGLELVAGIILAATGVLAFLAVPLLITGATTLLGGLLGSGLNKDQGQCVSSRNPNPPWRVVYGFTRLAGVVTFLGTHGNNNEYLDIVCTLAKGKVHQVGTMYFDGTAIPLDSNGNGQGQWNGHVHVETDVGDPNNTSQPFPGLAAVQPGYWNNTCLQRGHAKAYIRLKWSSTLFVSGCPNITFDIQGRECYDPRTSTIAFTQNPAVCLRDYLTDQELGLQCDPTTTDPTTGLVTSSTEIDDDSFIAAANACDQTVSLIGCVQTAVPSNGHEGLGYAAGNIVSVFGGNGDCALWVAQVTAAGKVLRLNVIDPGSNYSNGTGISCSGGNGSGLAVDITTDNGSEPTYACNGVIQTTQTPGSVINDICNSMAGFCPYFQGKFFALPGVYPTPSISLGDDDFRAPLDVQVTTSRRDLFNSVHGSYLCEANDWQASDYPAIINGSYVNEDGIILWSQLDLPFTTSASMAQRIANIFLQRNRRQVTITAKCKLTAANIAPGDTIQLTHARFGWSNKTFFVQDVSLAIDKDIELGEGDNSPALGVDLLLRETDSGVYSWSTAQQQAAAPGASSSLPLPGTVQPVTSLSALSDVTTAVFQADGSVINRILVDWVSPADQFVLDGGNIVIEYAFTGTTDWSYIIIPGSATFTFISPVSSGQGYDINVWATNTMGASSSVSSLTNVVAGSAVGTLDIYLGPWSSTTAYTLNNEVSYQGGVYICIQACTNVVPTNTDYWVLLGSTQTFLGPWNSSATYYPGNEVSNAGELWICLVTNTNSEPPNSNWQLMGPTDGAIQISINSYIGPWSPTLLYDPGNEVSYDGNYWVCLQQNSGQVPALNSVYWQLVGAINSTASNPIQPWNSTTTYNKSDEVTFTSSSSGNGSVAASPTVATSVHRSGLTQNTWVSPANAEGSSSYATNTLYGSNNSVNQSDYLELSGFDFSAIPSGATPVGIAVSWNRAQTGGTSAVYDDVVTLSGLTGSVANRAPAYPNGEWPSSPTTVTYGGATDLWSVMPTLAQLQSNNFKLIIGCQCTLAPGNGALIELNSVRATIYYVTGGQKQSNYYKSLANGNLDHEPDTSSDWWQLVGPVSLDAVADGTNYAKIAASIVTDGIPDCYAGPWVSGNTYKVGQEVTYGFTPLGRQGDGSTGKVVNEAVLYSGGAFTLSLWLKPNALPQYNVSTTMEAEWDSVTIDEGFVRIASFSWNCQGDLASLEALFEWVYVNGGTGYNTSDGMQIPSSYYSGMVGVWNHIVCVSDGQGNYSLYLNGAQIATKSETGVFAGNPPTSTGLLSALCSYSAGGGNAAAFSPDSVSEVAVWNKALSQAEIALLYTGVSPANIESSTLAAAWGFEGTSPETDLSGNGCTGTVTDTTLVSGPSIASGGNFFRCQTANSDVVWTPSHWVLVGPNSLDNVADGVNYVRMPGANMDSHRRALIDFSQAGHINTLPAGRLAANPANNQKLVIDSSQPSGMNWVDADSIIGEIVTIPSHGFGTVGQLVVLQPQNNGLALAISTSTLVLENLLAIILDANTVKLVQGDGSLGLKLSTFPLLDNTYLQSNHTYYVSETTAGLLTLNEPSGSNVSNQLYYWESN